MSEADSVTILSSIDFTAFDTMNANTQTLIYNGYKIIARVAPDDKYCYQLSLALQSADSNPQPAVSDTAEAGEILRRMGADTSAGKKHPG